MAGKVKEIQPLGYCYTVEPDSLYISDWNVNQDKLFHRHPGEKKVLALDGGWTDVEWDVLRTNERICCKCYTQIPDTIWLIHKYYQIP